MLHTRIRRLEAVLQRRASPKTPSGLAVVWTAATCVKALRILLGPLATPADAVLSDPFPDLEGEDYLLAFWPWLLASDEPWPRWAQAYAHHVGAMALGNAGRIWKSGWPRWSSSSPSSYHVRLKAPADFAFACNLCSDRSIFELGCKPREMVERELRPRRSSRSDGAKGEQS